ncbi:glycosyltransferase family 4 protein [Candidatus Woesearchaeota archaeon]|nr:glycosyltransferase family 4 protein [Candidatus Woesearchaeota archaeon]
MRIKKELIKFEKRSIPKLNYGIIHSQVGFSDGVSIVMRQMESVMTEYMKIPKSNINYLVGATKNTSPRIRVCRYLWHKYHINKLMLNHFKEGYGGIRSEKIERAIGHAVDEIKTFVDDKDIDVIIAHNTGHPVNFIFSVALSRYYRNEIKKGRRTPKYIVWWHDSHLERKRFANPLHDVKRYLMQGVPGRFVEYILFINSLQFDQVQNYFLELDKKYHGYYDSIFHNHAVIYNTATTVINSYKDLERDEFTERTEKFLKAFGINRLIKRRKLNLSNVQFCLQHTRVVPRKRIDFGLRYAYELFDTLKKKRKTKAMIFFVSGHSGDETGNYKRKLIQLNEQLSKTYKTRNFFLIFAEDHKDSGIFFEEFPIIFTKLGGISTYFSEIEGFGNNLLEVMAAGLIPVVYTYPVFVKDIAKHKFKTVCLDRFNIDKESISKVVELIEKERMRKMWANKNLEILKRRFSNKIISWKLKRAIIRKRQHI